MRIKAYNIRWATDFHDPELLNLPNEVGIDLDNDQDPEDDLVEELEVMYGWPVDYVDYEEWDG